MQKAITITQNKYWLYNRALELGFYNNSNFQHDFLATCKGEQFGETKTYFFKWVFGVAAFSEVRFFKKSKRVTVSKYRTEK